MDLSSINILKQFNRECPRKKVVLEKVPHEVKKTNSKPLGVKNKPTVPPPSNASSLVYEKRQNLPIFAFRDEILHKIKNNRILLISGSTGSGKTTQIPQMILENANLENQPCRILCTQPRRISAIASGDRVCFERNEEAGTTIGYQIRLESKISPNTNCIFMTPGVFLRYLMSGKPEEILGNITHVLIDEAHERAKENDFLLTSIKENINANPNLKIIIMSATMNTAVFSDYFGGSETISIATKQFEVEEVYLEEILKTVNFRNRRVDELDEMFKSGKLVAASQSAYVNEENTQPTETLDVETVEYLNEILESLSSSESPETELNQFMYLVQAENVPVNFRHEKTNMTALMIAVGRGLVSSADELMKLDADPYAKVLFGDIELNSLDIAYRLHGGDSEIKRIIQFHMDNR